MSDYTYQIEWQEDGQVFAAKCNEFPWVRGFADTEEKAIEAIKNIMQVIEEQFGSFLHAQ